MTVSQRLKHPSGETKSTKETKNERADKLTRQGEKKRGGRKTGKSWRGTERKREDLEQVEEVTEAGRAKGAGCLDTQVLSTHTLERGLGWGEEGWGERRTERDRRRGEVTGGKWRRGASPPHRVRVKHGQAFRGLLKCRSNGMGSYVRKGGVKKRIFVKRKTQCIIKAADTRYTFLNAGNEKRFRVTVLTSHTKPNTNRSLFYVELRVQMLVMLSH